MAAPQLIVLGNEKHGTNIKQTDPRQSVVNSASHELIFGVVGHVGSGTSEIANALREALIDVGTHDVHILKARKVITDWAQANGKAVPDPANKHLDATEILQDYGDEMRMRTTESGAQDHSAIARGLVREIRGVRQAAVAAAKAIDGVNPLPSSAKRAYILDALRHPAEVYLLQKIYQEALVLVGVVCEEGKRQARISAKYDNAGKDRALEFMRRDAKAKEKHGQRVADAFHLSDFFVDNTSDRFIKGNVGNPQWDVVEKLRAD